MSIVCELINYHRVFEVLHDLLPARITGLNLYNNLEIYLSNYIKKQELEIPFVADAYLSFLSDYTYD